MKKALLIFLIGVCVWELFYAEKSVELGPGVMAAEDPVQENFLFADSFVYREYKITPMADFIIKAKIFSKKKYSMGREAALSPIDFALGRNV